MTDSLEVEAGGHTVTVTHPDKAMFPNGITKGDLVAYYLAVADGALAGVKDRPCTLRRYPNGVDQKSFFQKRLPTSRPDWVGEVAVQFVTTGPAIQLCPASIADVLWSVNLGCIDLNPTGSRRNHLDRPDELRVDLDPEPGVAWSTVRSVGHLVRTVLAEAGLEAWVKTSGSRGLHIYAPIEPRYTFDLVWIAGVALAREMVRRAPDDVTVEWFKADRGTRIFVDVNQNGSGRTTAAAYSVRPSPNGRVSAPVRWAELDTCELDDFTVTTMVERYREVGDLQADLHRNPAPLDTLLEWAKRDAAAGLKVEDVARAFRRQG